MNPLWEEQLDALQHFPQTPLQTIIRFEAAPIPAFDHELSSRLIQKIEADLLGAFLHGTEVLRLHSFLEELLVDRGSFGEKETGASGNFKGAHAVLVTIRGGDKAKIDSTLPDDLDVRLTE